MHSEPGLLSRCNVLFLVFMLILSLCLPPASPLNLTWTEACAGASALLCVFALVGVLKFTGDDEYVMFGPRNVWASCCINNGNTAGGIYSNNGRRL